ncbi:MAG: ATPase, T2SS/T4P/T4SS family [Candidatus Brocadiia bacterium]
MIRKKRLGELLVEEKVISLPQLHLALEKMKFSKLRLGEQLAKLKICTEKDIVEALSKQAQIPIVDLNSTKFDTEITSIVPRSLAVECNCFPFQIEGQYLHVAFADPLRVDQIQLLEAKTKRVVKKYIAAQSEIEKAIESHYAVDDAAHAIMNNLASLGDLSTAPASKDLDKELDRLASSVASAESTEDLASLELKKAAEDRGVIATVNQIINIAVRSGASEIQLDPQPRQLLVRQRIDGILQDLTKLPRSVQASVTSRIKVIAGLDVSQSKTSQDGKVRITIEKDREIDLRVSTFPAMLGEKVTIRILDQGKAAVDLESIFFDEGQLKKIESIIRSPQGIILVTGPLGAGKTTALYAIIQRLVSPDVSVVTIENPIERELDGVNQIQINNQIGMSFSKVLRSVLHQDPKVILVGETADRETAEVAFQAAQTGHLVLSTMQTGSTGAALSRLLALGISPKDAAGSILAITSQRLVRRVCPDCKEPTATTADLVSRYNFPSGTLFFKGKGCERCNYTGYKGRLAVAEIMVFDDELRAAIAANKSEEEVKRIARKNGMETITQVGRRFIEYGLTNLDELHRSLEEREADAQQQEGPTESSTVDAPESHEVTPQEITDRFNVSKGEVIPPDMPFFGRKRDKKAPVPSEPEEPPDFPEPTPEVLKCTTCGEQVMPQWRACPSCGSRLQAFKKSDRCHRCGESIKPHWKVCPNCEADLTGGEPRKAEAPAKEPIRLVPVVKDEPTVVPIPQSVASANRPGDMVSIEGVPRVLVVDDQKSMQKLVSIAIKGVGCEVATADDGLEALEVIKRYRPHLIILDIVMPKMDGLEVCRRLRADVRTAFIPIMMLTSLSDDKSRLKGYVAGTDDYLAKPFVLEEFYTRVRNLLRRTYGYFSLDEDLQTSGNEWDASTEEARTRQKMIDRQSHLEHLGESGSPPPGASPPEGPEKKP